MNGASTTWLNHTASESRWLPFAMLFSAGTLTVVATIIGNGNVGVALAPILILSALVAGWVLPLRWSLFALLFLCLSVDVPGDVGGNWTSSVAWVGQILIYNLNKTVPIGALAIPGMTLWLVYALVIHVHRRLSGQDDIDGVSAGSTSKFMLAALAVGLVTVVALIGEGLFRHGDAQMAKNQVQGHLQVLLLGYLLSVSLRGEQDYRVLGRLVLTAACIKVSMAAWVWHLFPDAEFNARTNHGDSMTFAIAAVMLLVLWFERSSWRNALKLGIFLPWLIYGMVANNRRLVWVHLAASLLVFLFMSRRSRIKTVLARAALCSVPLIAIYLTAGWEQKDSGFFAPVQTIRSMSDKDVDSSTLYRDIENYNLLWTIRQNPVTGAGFGQAYQTVVAHADISFFKEYLFFPHNSILGAYYLSGMFGFAGLFLPIVIGVFLSAHRYFHGSSPIERAAAFTAIATFIVYLLQCYGDLGFSEIRSIYLTGSALAIAGQHTLRRHGLPSFSRPGSVPRT